jgi:hypothetical protein
MTCTSDNLAIGADLGLLNPVHRALPSRAMTENERSFFTATATMRLREPTLREPTLSPALHSTSSTFVMRQAVPLHSVTLRSLQLHPIQSHPVELRSMASPKLHSTASNAIASHESASNLTSSPSAGSFSPVLTPLLLSHPSLSWPSNVTTECTGHRLARHSS